MLLTIYFLRKNDMHEKRKTFKNLVLCGLGLTMPATFIISASCQQDDSTEKYLY
ncbi:Uncharacterised protein [Mycoplasmopsis arginini]|nr:Uncharacterised protein [Mycoplasmopsis arginini]